MYTVQVCAPLPDNTIPDPIIPSHIVVPRCTGKDICVPVPDLRCTSVYSLLSSVPNNIYSIISNHLQFTVHLAFTLAGLKIHDTSVFTSCISHLLL